MKNNWLILSAAALVLTSCANPNANTPAAAPVPASPAATPASPHAAPPAADPGRTGETPPLEQKKPPEPSAPQEKPSYIYDESENGVQKAVQELTGKAPAFWPPFGLGS